MATETLVAVPAKVEVTDSQWREKLVSRKTIASLCLTVRDGDVTPDYHWGYLTITLNGVSTRAAICNTFDGECSVRGILLSIDEGDTTFVYVSVNWNESLAPIQATLVAGDTTPWYEVVAALHKLA